MMKKVLILFLFIPWNLSAMADSALQKLYLDADYVAHVSIGEPVTNTGFSSDMGTSWYRMVFRPLEVYKNRDTACITECWFVHYGYDEPDPGLMLPGKQLIIFLKRSGLTDDASVKALHLNPWKFDLPVIMDGGAHSWDPHLNQRIQQFRKGTAFDRAVTGCRWSRVERMIRHRVNIASGKYGPQTAAAVGYVNQWIKRHYTVDDIAMDSCAIHICIYPGWSDSGIRFLTSSGPREFGLTINMGKVIRWRRCFTYMGISSRSRDRVYFRSFRPAPGILQQIDATCKAMDFSNKQGWRPQEGVRIKVECPKDSIMLYPGTPPLIRVKLTMVNISDGPLNILWPENQNDGYQIIHLKLHEEDGNTLEEEEYYPPMSHDETIIPSVITVEPGDSLTAYHSLNDPFGGASDISACHWIPYIRESRYLLSVVYTPLLDGDTSRYWNPENGSREVFCPQVIHTYFGYTPQREDTLNVMMLEKSGIYLNAFGQRCVYNGLVMVLGAPESSGYQPGDTLAYRFTYNLRESWQEVSRPALDAELAQPGDILQLIVNGSFPSEAFTKGNSGIIRNLLLADSPDAVKILSH